MKISISYRHIESPHAIKSALDRHVAKIRKLLKSYEPDLVQLHGGFEKQPHRAEYIFSANLSLPTGTLHANGEGSDGPQAREKLLSSSRRRSKSISLGCVKTTNGSASAGKPSKPSPKDFVPPRL